MVYHRWKVARSSLIIKLNFDFGTIWYPVDFEIFSGHGGYGKVYIQPQEHFTRNIIITSIAQYSTKYCAHSTFCVMKGGGCAMTKNTLIKVLGLAATVIGAGMSLVTDWVNELKMEEKIEEKVNEALAKTDEEES